MAEPLNATFFAFRKRERSGVLLQTSIAFVVGMIVLIGAFIGLFWASVGPVIQWYGQLLGAAATNDTTAMANTTFPTGLFTFIGGLLLWLFPVYILCAAFEAGCLRWMIHGEVSGVMGLSLGAPTWRVWSCYWMWFLLNMAFSFVIQIVMMIVVGVLAATSGGDPTAAFGATMIVVLVQYVLLAYFAVRFAPATATTIAKRKFAFFDAWTVTKGRFWALFGSFLLLYVIYAVAWLGLTAVWFSTMLSGVDLSGLSDPTRASEVMQQILQGYLQSFTNPQTWALVGALTLVSTIFALMLYIAMYGVNARAVIAAAEEGKIEGVNAESLAKTFG